MSPWDIPDLDLPPEKADEVIEKVARSIVNSGLGTPVIMTLDMVKPMGPYLSASGFILGYPFFPLIPGNWGFNLVSLFHDIQNVEKLIRRIESLMKEEDEARKLEKEKRKKENPEGKKSLRNLFKINF